MQTMSTSVTRDAAESDEYVFAGGLAPVTIDREADSGTYWEPNVWMRHRLAP
jgi:hypothetical protein